MAEYCEYMWDPSRAHANHAIARCIYEEQQRFNVRDKKLAIKAVRGMLQDMPGVELKECTDEYITRFLLARKYRTEQAAELIAAYQAQLAQRQDIFGNLTACDPTIQSALRAGIPGVLPARDRKGRCVLIVLASQWDPIAIPALAVQRAIFLVLETLIQDPRNQQSGFVAVVDWSGFTLRQGGALGAGALRNLISTLRGRFPARFKAIHFISAPLYVQATLALVKPFLDEKTRKKIYLHGNNLSTLHQHLPLDILPSELGGTGPAFNPGLWAEPVIHTAVKEAELSMENGHEPEIQLPTQSAQSSTRPERRATRREAGDGSETRGAASGRPGSAIEMRDMQQLSASDLVSEAAVNDDEDDEGDSPNRKLSNSRNSEPEAVRKEKGAREEKRNLIS